MKTIYSYYKYVLAIVLMMSGAQTLQAQEAFYVYRNDGDFNGFFYDQVKRMGCSKTGLEGEEHDDYVVQEIETADSLYRIPLAAIDSIGFQQPEIRLNPRFKDYRNNSELYFVLDPSEEKIGVVNGGEIDEKYIASRIAPGDVLCFYINEEKEFETSTNEPPYSDIVTVPFICKITEVNGFKLSYAPITTITDVFEQFISVEQIGQDAEGNVRTRVAGANQLRRVSGSRDLTLIDLNTTTSVSLEPKKNLKFSLGVNVELKTTAEVVYNIGWSSGIYTKLTMTDELSAGFFGSADLQIDGSDDLWESSIGSRMPVMFPSFLPLFEIRPIPGLFLRAEGHATATLQSPKFISNSKRSITINSNQPWRSVVSAQFGGDTTLPSDKDNKWQLMLSLNGFIQMGFKVPLRIYTCSWARELLEMSIGTDLYIGPKLSANFSMDVGQLADGSLYDALSGTNIQLSALAIDAKTNATFTGPDPTSFGEKFTEKFDILESSLSYGTATLNLLPTFEYVEFDGNNWAIAPRGNYLTCQMGIAIFDSNDRFIYYSPDIIVSETHSVWNTVDEIKGYVDGDLPFGKYKVCPAVYMMGFYMIAKSQGKDYTHENDHIHFWSTEDGACGAGGWIRNDEFGNEYSGFGYAQFSKDSDHSGTLYITGLDDLCSDVSISKEGDFFDYQLGSSIDPLNDYSDYKAMPEADFLKNCNYQPHKYYWKPLRITLTNTSVPEGELEKDGFINLTVTRDGVKKTNRILVSYNPN